MRIRLVILFLLAFVLNVSAQNPSTILIQLGVKGITSVGGSTNYGNCLVKTKPDGTIDSSLTSGGGGSTGTVVITRLNKVRYIDSVNGTDVVGSGAITSPYKTFAYAITQNDKPVVYVFAPGTYTSPGADIVSVNKTDMTLVGYDYKNTTITGLLQFMTGSDVNLNVYNIWLTSGIRQDSPTTMVLNLYDHARVDAFQAMNPSNSVLMVYRDPTIDWDYPDNSYLTISNLCYASRIVFVPTNSLSALWTNGVYDVGKALNELPSWVTNWVVSQQYVTSAVTNGLAGASWVTNWVQAKGYLTNYVELDPIWSGVSNQYASTNWVNAHGYLTNYVELDPIWSGVSNQYASTNWVNAHGYLTNYVELDPIWSGVSNQYASTSWVLSRGFITSISNSLTIPGNLSQRYSKFNGTVNSNTYPAWEITFYNGGFGDPTYTGKVYFSSSGWNFTGTNMYIMNNGGILADRNWVITNFAAATNWAMITNWVVAQGYLTNVTLQMAANAGGTITGQTVTIDAANECNNTYGGGLVTLGRGINAGRVEGGVQSNSYNGGFNFGHLRDAACAQIMDSSPFDNANSSLNMGDLMSGSTQYMSSTAYGAMNVGALMSGSIQDCAGASINHGTLFNGSAQHNGLDGNYQLGYVRNTSTQTIGVVSGVGSMNFGRLFNNCLQYNNGRGSVNVGSLNGYGQQYIAAGEGDMNIGYVVSQGLQYINANGAENHGSVNQSIQTNVGSGSVNAGYLVGQSLQFVGQAGSFNFGSMSGSTQSVTGAGSGNIGVLYPGVQTNAGNGSFNIGSLSGSSIQSISATVYGGMNIGELRNGSIQSIAVGSKGSLNLGYLDGQFQFMTGSGSVTFVPNVTNSHDRSFVFRTNANSVANDSMVVPDMYTMSLYPSASNQYDLGSSNMPYRSGYFGTNSVWLGDYQMTKARAQAWDVAANLASGTNDVVFDASNTRTNTYGGYLSILGNRVVEGSGSFARAIGAESHAEGYKTIASGGGSHAEGVASDQYGIIAAGSGSHAGGFAMPGSGYILATNNGSFAGGYVDAGDTTIASGIGSFAYGRNVRALDPNSVAFGQSTVASGTTAYAEGYNTRALGSYSHAEGQNTSTEPGSLGVHVEGYGTVGVGWWSHAEGCGSRAGGNNSHAEGYYTLIDILAHSAHAEGYGTRVGTNCIGAHAEGCSQLAMVGDKNIFAGAPGSHVEGYATRMYNPEPGEPSTTNSMIMALNVGAHAGGCVANGETNSAEGAGGFVHGEQVRAYGQCSFALGQNIIATNNNVFAWSDGQTPNYADHGSNTFNIRALGGIWADANIFPGASNQYSIGSAALPFKDIYVGTSSLHIGSTVISQTKVANWDAAANFPITGITGTPIGITTTVVAFANASAWECAASSADGRVLAAGHNTGAYISTNAGTNWVSVPVLVGAHIQSACMSHDGRVIALGSYNDEFVMSHTKIYISVDYGVNWTGRGPVAEWQSLDCTADGSIILADYNNGDIYVSTDYGTNFNYVSSSPGPDLMAVAISSNGSTSAFMDHDGDIWLSPDLGTNLVQVYTGSAYFAMALAISDDGTKILSGGGAPNPTTTNAPLVVSVNRGTNWTVSSGLWSDQYWLADMSADGRKMFASITESGSTATYKGAFVYSLDSGTTWHAAGSSAVNNGIACSSDGKQIITTDYGTAINKTQLIPSYPSLINWGSIVPSEADLSDIGSAAKPYKNVYATRVISTTGKSCTGTWIDDNLVTNAQVFVSGQLTSWTTNGVEIP